MKITAAAIVACTPAIAGTIDDRVADSAYLRYAEGFAPYTARLEMTNAGGQRQVATATLIADHWALTAAHVVSGCTAVSVNGTPADEVIIHKDWKDVFGEFDIALVRTGAPHGLAFYPPLATRRYDVGSTVSIAGYGVTGPMSVGHNAADNRLRAGTNTILRYERHMLVCAIRRGTSPLEFGIAPGDSGGPVFAGGELIGVNSLTMREKGPLLSRDGEESGHTDVFEFVPWIEEVMSAR